MDGVPHLLHFLDRHFKAHQKPAVQILPHSPPQRVYARKIARRLDEVREVDDLFQHRHVRLSGRVPEDRIVNFIVHAEHVPRERRAGLGVEQLERLFLQRVERDARTSHTARAAPGIESFFVQSCSSPATSAR